MERWPLGVFASIDAGLGVRLEVVRELGVPTIQLHAPSRAVRTKERAREFLARLDDFGIRITVVFGGFEGVEGQHPPQQLFEGFAMEPAHAFPDVDLDVRPNGLLGHERPNQGRGAIAGRKMRHGAG